MRAVKSSSFLLAAVAVAAGLNETWALPAAVVGFLLSLVPMFTAPRLVPEQDGTPGTHAGTRYKLHGPLTPQPPSNPAPAPAYRPGSWE